MENAAADVAVLPACADRTKDMTAQKERRAKLILGKLSILGFPSTKVFKDSTAIYDTGTVVPEEPQSRSQPYFYTSITEVLI